MGVPKYDITLSEDERKVLNQIVRKQTSSQNIVRRARIILRADEGQQRNVIAAELGIEEHSALRG